MTRHLQMVEESDSVENILGLALDLAEDQAVDKCLAADKLLKDWEKR